MLGWVLRFEVFVAGAVVMALEIVASRLLAPVFGDSVFVWGSLIGIIMASLSLGYYLGGSLADRRPSFRIFSTILFAAGLLILFIPLAAPTVLEMVFYSPLGDRYGPLLVSLLLLAAPTMLLGMVSPYSIRLATVNIVNVGGISGSLYSISTMGSILGTFFTVFVLVPTFGVRTIIYSLGVVLIAVSLIGLARGQKVLAILLAGSIMAPSTLFLSGTISIHMGELVYQKDTPYNSMYIVDSDGVRTMFLNSMPHSAMYLNGSNEMVFLYTDYFHIAFIFNPHMASALFIGGGGFSGPKKFLEDYPNMTIDVVEIDAEVIEAAKEFFNVTDDPRLGISVEDGRAFLSGDAEKYDLVVLDAYSKTHVPFHLMTVEFFQMLHEHLNQDGVVVSNFISSLIGDTSDLLRAEYKTMASVFPQVYLFYTKSSSLATVQNIIIVATKIPVRFTGAELIGMAMHAPKRAETMSAYAATYAELPANPGDVPLLTDNYAPVESLLNPVTGAPYEGGEEIIPRGTLSPLMIAGFWMLITASIYLVVMRMRLRAENLRKEEGSARFLGLDFSASVAHLWEFDVLPHSV